MWRNSHQAHHAETKRMGGVGYFSLNWDWNPQPHAKFSALTLPDTPADEEVSFDVCLLMCKMDVFCDAGCWLQAVCHLDMILLSHCFMISAQAQFLKKRKKHFIKNFPFAIIVMYTVSGHLLFCVLQCYIMNILKIISNTWFWCFLVVVYRWLPCMWFQNTSCI